MYDIVKGFFKLRGGGYDVLPSDDSDTTSDDEYSTEGGLD